MSETIIVEHPVIIIRNGCVVDVDGVAHYSKIDLDALQVGTCPICDCGEMDRSGRCPVCGYRWGPESCGADSYETIIQQHRAYLSASRKMAALAETNPAETFRVRWCERAQEITVQVEETAGHWLCLHDSEGE